TNARDMAFLTIVPSVRTELLGLIAKVPNADWVALDAREEGYDRLVATEMITHDHSDNPELAIYAIPEVTRFPPTPDHPILLSYLDVVLQGYLHVFGAAGVQHFMETTDGWDTVVLNDRTNPIYPRAQSLSVDETALVDACLTQVGAQLRD
ncbi:MAG: gamma-glutamylcyclotransferase, partial [Rhodobacteraceae bacterium]|nr:gamma-glutamylcyclotransferase [Paracoccaceae bacterium]